MQTYRLQRRLVTGFSLLVLHPPAAPPSPPPPAASLPASITASVGPPLLPPLPRIFRLKRKSRSGVGPAGAEEEAGEKADQEEEDQEDHRESRFMHASPVPDDEIVELPAAESGGDPRTEEDVADEEVARVEGVRIVRFSHPRDPLDPQVRSALSCAPCSSPLLSR